jgi:hypothetical protein
MAASTRLPLCCRRDACRIQDCNALARGSEHGFGISSCSRNAGQEASRQGGLPAVQTIYYPGFNIRIDRESDNDDNEVK